MVPGDDLLIFRGTPCKFEGCIHFSHLIFDAGLASSRKTAIGPKNPLLLAFSPGPKKTHIFSTGLYGLITGFVRVKYGFLKPGVFREIKKYGFCTG